jgi:hypothetical protein
MSIMFSSTPVATNKQEATKASGLNHVVTLKALPRVTFIVPYDNDRVGGLQ